VNPAAVSGESAHRVRGSRGGGIHLGREIPGYGVRSLAALTAACCAEAFRGAARDARDHDPTPGAWRVPSCGVRAISRSWCAPGRCPGRRTTPASPISTNGFGGRSGCCGLATPFSITNCSTRASRQRPVALAAIPFRDGRDHDLSGDGTDRHLAAQAELRSLPRAVERAAPRRGVHHIYTGRVLSRGPLPPSAGSPSSAGRIAAWRSRAGIPSRAPRRPANM